MSTTYRLHYAPDNASLCIRLAFEEMGLAYDTALVDRSVRAQDGDAYRSLNPNGPIPVLETDQGAIYETGAILLWLSERHGQLAPASDDPKRGEFLKWLFWISNTLHPALRMLFYPEKFSSDVATINTITRERLSSYLDILEASFDFDEVTVLSCYLAPLIRWLSLFPRGETEWFDIARYPRIQSFAQMMEQRPSALALAQGEGLGPTPFSAPSYATPPEGSAT